MKKLLFIVCLCIGTTLLSFSILKKDHPENPHLLLGQKGTCLPPTGLSSSRSGNVVTFTWIAAPGVSSYSCGGYYNRTGTNPPYVINFGNVVSGTTMMLTLTPTFVSGTFRVTSECSDGTESSSGPANF